MAEHTDIETGETQFRLAEAYEDGKGVGYDLDLAVALYEKSARLGHLQAQYHLGFFYYHGVEDLGAEPNYEKAAIWYLMAAEQGYAETQCELGGMYREGIGVPKNDEEAARWLLKAAEQGHPGVAYYLGEMYRRGEGVPADNTKAYMWSKVVQHRREFDTGDTEEIIHLKENMSLEEVHKAEALATDWIDNYMMPNK